ncbi:COP9 signalosome complex subunit 6-like protein [Euroglyphus maynei]|uniref:COP9 signalosome complex subunit 6 n=1 Tax=Euroglyphus maynei TaxID=6958 RepID=A0A1Y3B5V1_EURMA|nr:COP9 signalosome complex subunit 6-like protein [Euroglyphus maynei]
MDVSENDNNVVTEVAAAMEIDGNEDVNKDTNNGETILVSSSTIAATISVSLHPLVILNVSEHWTRIRAQECVQNGNNAQQQQQPQTKVFGALIGKQKGRNIEIMNSFELKSDIIDNAPVVDMDFYRSKEAQFKQVFAEMELLGWYTNGDSANKNDMIIHKQMVEINENCLCLKLNPLSRHTGLPIKIYESIIDMVACAPTMLFVEVPYTLATEEAERIVLDHMARMTSTSHNGENVNSVVTEHLRVQHSAVKMLRDRIKLILDFVKDVKNKNIPANHEILREILNLCHRLPLISSDTFNEDFYIQCNDVALITYLGTLTKCTNSINQYANKFNVLLDRTGRRSFLSLY